MPATKRGIYHNLMESEYVVSNSEITFFFSSKVYLIKFLDRYKEHRQLFSEKMKKVTSNTPFNFDTLADISLYKEIETRGFFVRLQGVKIGWNDLYKYSLRKMIDQNSSEWGRVYGKETDIKTALSKRTIQIN